MYNQYLSYLLIPILIILFNFDNSREVSSKYFIDNFLENTTQIDFYSNNISDIYLNNQTRSLYHINLTKSPEFYKIISESSCNFKINKKLEPRTNYNGFIILLLILIGYFILIKHIRQKSAEYQIIYANKKNKKYKKRITLDNVAGLNHAKEEIYDFIDL